MNKTYHLVAEIEQLLMQKDFKGAEYVLQKGLEQAYQEGYDDANQNRSIATPLESQENIGRAIRLLRITECVSQEELADKLNQAGWKEVDQSVISRIESEKRQIESHEIELICKVLGFSKLDFERRVREINERKTQ